MLLPYDQDPEKCIVGDRVAVTRVDLGEIENLARIVIARACFAMGITCVMDIKFCGEILAPRIWNTMYHRDSLLDVDLLKEDYWEYERSCASYVQF